MYQIAKSQINFEYILSYFFLENEKLVKLYRSYKMTQTIILLFLKTIFFYLIKNRLLFNNILYDISHFSYKVIFFFNIQIFIKKYKTQQLLIYGDYL